MFSKRTRGNEKNSAFKTKGKILRGTQLHIADRFGFLDLVVRANLRAVVCALPDGEWGSAAKEHIGRIAIAARDELRFECCFAISIGG